MSAFRIYKAWKANKKSVGNGSYKYVCCAVKNKGECTRQCLAGENYCKKHYNPTCV